MHSELKPCPFCGSSKVRIADVMDFHFVKCDFCGNEGLKDDAVEEAIEAWNRRVLPQEPSSASMGVVKAAEAKLSAYAFDEDDETEFSREDAVFILHALASLSQPAKGEREGGGQALVDADQNVASNEAAAAPANPAQVTDAMVDAAARAYAERQNGKGCPVWEEELPPMRAALTAAIGAGGQAVAPSISPAPVQEEERS